MDYKSLTEKGEIPWTSEQTDVLPLDSKRKVWISSGLTSLGDVFEISFGVFSSQIADSWNESAVSLKKQNLLTLADLSKIGDILADYINLVAYKRCVRRNSYKCDEIIFTPISWGRYIATKRVLRKAMRRFPQFVWEFSEEEFQGEKYGYVKITIN